MNTINTSLRQRIRINLLKLFSLKDDKADDQVIDQSLRAAAEIKGTNLWVLMFAIFVASIGLNVNSTAVIIGAMLISPLMGPIMGIGYGVGIFDFTLIKNSFKNLCIAVFISLCVSTAYFLCSPLTQAQSELLARTTPTIWDVLIALFGGLAGIVAATRKEKSNVIPGVAIATALMPPLCTAGYSLANGQLEMFAGAFYLFMINGVFIAIASASVTRAFQVKEKVFMDKRRAKRVHFYVLTVALLTVIPSIYLASTLVQHEIFKSNAIAFVQNELSTKHEYVAQTKIDAANKVIEVIIVGDYLADNTMSTITEQLKDAGLEGAQLKVHQASQAPSLDTQKTFTQDIRTNVQLISQKDERVNTANLTNIPKELHALYPQIKDIIISEGVDENSNEPVVVLNVKINKPLSKTERRNIESWLKVRVDKPVQIIIN